MFVLDTNVVSTFRKATPHPAVTPWIAQTGWQAIATTVITIIELQRGVERARVQHPYVADNVERWLTGLLAAGTPQVLPMGVMAARLLARMHETPALRHFVLTDPQAKEQATGADLAIAAIAITAGAAVATGNAKHFLQINAWFPLPGLFDPMAQAWHVTVV